MLLKLGLVDYLEAWELQRSLAEARRNGRGSDTLILLEHPHTYTIGRRGTEEHLLVDKVFLTHLGAKVYQVDRGGDITYHGPGQLVGYPIIDLRHWGNDVGWYLRQLEEVLIGVMAAFGIAATRLPGYTGVWVGDSKLAAIGIKVANSITTHGFALNVNTDLSYFDYIVPCGLPGKGVTSMAQLLGKTVEIDTVADRIAARFGQEFGLTMVETALEQALR